MIDDASSELLARFALADSTKENLRMLDLYLRNKASHFRQYKSGGGTVRARKSMLSKRGATLLGRCGSWESPGPGAFAAGQRRVERSCRTV
jgi:hypothetical protein